MPDEQHPAFPALAPAAAQVPLGTGTAGAAPAPQQSFLGTIETDAKADATKVESFFLAHPLVMFGTGALIGACVALVIVHTLF